VPFDHSFPTINRSERRIAVVRLMAQLSSKMPTIIDDKDFGAE